MKFWVLDERMRDMIIAISIYINQRVYNILSPLSKIIRRYFLLLSAATSLGIVSFMNLINHESDVRSWSKISLVQETRLGCVCLINSLHSNIILVTLFSNTFKHISFIRKAYALLKSNSTLLLLQCPIDTSATKSLFFKSCEMIQLISPSWFSKLSSCILKSIFI